MRVKNPFEYDGANKFSDAMIADYYIDDFNYSRFIQSKRNVFLVGERGSGKTMALLFNRFRVQQLIASRDGNSQPLDFIGVYIACNNPLTQKTEYQLLNEFEGTVLSEHFFVLSIAFAFAETVSRIPDVLAGADESKLRSEVSFVFGDEIPEVGSLFESIKHFVQREILKTQRAVNSNKLDVYYENAFSFATVIVPLLNLAKELPKLNGSHFMLMIDDAQFLNDFQIQALNSWIRFRDNLNFSFKVAVAKAGKKRLKTASGGSILEGHDYSLIDLEAPFQNKDADFHFLAKRLIERRLKKFHIEASPEDFFPISPAMLKDLKASEAVVRKEAVEKYGSDKKKAIADHVYKYKRVHYFRNRAAKSNRPPYSGLDLLVHLSTGVVRNLLEPCYWMYDKAISLEKNVQKNDSPIVVQKISPKVQTEVILDRSRRLWDWVRDGLDQNIEGCSIEDARRANNLLDALAVLFRERLLHHKSEPRAIVFSISEQNSDVMPRVNHLIDILRKAQLVFSRSGPKKEKGRRENFYVLNRMLWPERGLDPHGQHARVSLKASAIWHVAEHATEFPVSFDTNTSSEASLWDE